MAKVFGVFCVVLLLNFNLCHSFQDENLESSRYDVESKLESIRIEDAHSIHLIKRRQTGATTEYKQIPEATPITTDINLNATATNTSDVKQEPPGTVDSGGISTQPTVNMTLPIVPTVNRPLLGVNGTGQRKELLSTTVSPEIIPQQTTRVPKITKLSTPKKAISTEEMPLTDKVIDGIDTSENNTNDGLKQHNITKYDEDYHIYYNSSIRIDKETIQKYWEEFRNISPNGMLSRSHRRAMTVKLSFDFPFYGHRVRNVTVATGGFLYTGEYVHSWLAATQYIAPLMANFDTSLSNDSFVKYSDNGSAFTVLWEKVVLQDKPEVGTFTFAATLYKTGNIEFTYFSVPIEIEAIQDDKHPVKVGLSDAYIIDKIIFFARRKTIYEYHRVNFQSPHIQNNTIITLNALKTCLEFTDCVSCVTAKTNFDCIWCPTLNKCSTGTDRKRQDWLYKGCDRTQIKVENICPAIGEKGNNAAAQQESDSITNDTSSNSNWNSNLNNEFAGDQSVHTVSTVMRNVDKSQMELSTKENENKSVGVVLGFMLPICLIMCALVWVLYAYRNPHTKSGQLLIQYRPSQWTWRRGEARYTAATIHM